jgi:hypothetical protein
MCLPSGIYGFPVCNHLLHLPVNQNALRPPRWLRCHSFHHYISFISPIKFPLSPLHRGGE